MKNKFDVSLLIVRVTFSFVMLAHGVQKLFGWFGGFGYTNTINFFTDTVGLPFLLAFSVILLESLGMISLLTGLFTRFLSFGVIAIMIGAIVKVHFANGFFMNWTGSQAGEGFELHLLIIGMASMTALFGGGRYSLDNYLGNKFPRSAQGFKSISDQFA